MAAINASFKKRRAPGPQNEPVMVYFGVFPSATTLFPIAVGNYHLWDVPPKMRIIDGYVQVVVAGGGASAAILGIMKNDDATSVDAGETIVGAITSGTVGVFRHSTATPWTMFPVPEPTVLGERYVLVWNREAVQTTTGERIIVVLFAVRDDLT